MRRMREDRRRLGASADLPGMRRHALLRVLAGMAVRRTIATQGDAAFLAGPQMHPVRADLHAFFAFAALRLFD